MTDDDPTRDPHTEPSDSWPNDPRRWLKPLLFFALALAFGLGASALWLHLHPRPVAPVPTDTAVTLDPTHRPLPAPMAGAATNLPAPSSSITMAGAPHIVSAAPDAAASPAPEMSMYADAGNAEVAQGTSAAVSSGVSEHADTEPQMLERSEPDYPMDALRARAEGQVRLKVSLDAQGNVVDVRVTDSSGTAALDRAAVDAARSSRYKPATHDGQPVAGAIDVPIDFTLDEQP